MVGAPVGARRPPPSDEPYAGRAGAGSRAGGGGRGANGSDAFGIAGLCLVVGVGVGMVVAAKLGLRGAR